MLLPRTREEEGLWREWVSEGWREGTRLAMAVHESLSQRLIVRHHLNGLDRAELDDYLTHRLRLAGCELPLFKPCAVEALFQSTRGLPRLINRMSASTIQLTRRRSIP